MKRLLGALLVGAAIMTSATYYAQSNPPKNPAASTEWPTYGQDPGGMRYSPVTQITPAAHDVRLDAVVTEADCLFF